MEHPSFENRIIRKLVENCGDIPIVSVSQKPINLGTNICVGDVGVSGFNMFRQVLIGCEAIKTKYVLSAEADCLYPPDYFTYYPPKEDVCFRNSNLYVSANKRSWVFKKEEGATHAQVVGREYYIARLKELFKGAPEWSEREKNFPRERHHKVDVFDKIEYYKTKNPVLQIKTNNSMRHYTRSDRKPRYNLRYWGDTKTLLETYGATRRVKEN